MRHLSLLGLLAFLFCFSCVDVTEEPSFYSSSPQLTLEESPFFRIIR